MGLPHLRVALAGAAFVLVGALLGGCGGGDSTSTIAAEPPAGAVSGAADDMPEASTGELESTKAARRDGMPTSKPPERGEPIAGGDESPRQKGNRSGAKRQGRPLEKLNELVEGRVEQASTKEGRTLRRLAEEALSDPGAGASAPDRSLTESAEAILEDD